MKYIRIIPILLVVISLCSCGVKASTDEIYYGQTTYLTVVTDTTVTEMNLYDRNLDRTMHLEPNRIYVNSVVLDGDNLIWTIGYYESYGQHVYDLSVKSGEEWFDYNNVLSINILRELQGEE